jgi:transmembrane sensor
MPHREPASEIDDAATVWAAKAERGLTEADRAEFDRWIEGDSRRLGAYVRAQAAWIHAERAAALGRMPEPEDISAPESSTPPQESRPGAIGRRVMLGGGAAIAASAAAVFVFGIDHHRTLESGVGEIRHIALKGGTTLTLDTDTRVDLAISSDDRRLDLVRGKLFLDIARSQERPLVVKVGGLLLEAAEGAFAVQSLVQAPIMALVTEGRVLATQSDGFFGQQRSLTVDKGHALTIASGQRLLPSEVQPVATSQQAQMLAWRDGMLAFGGDLLANAVRAFDRYGSVRIMVDPALARQKVTGLFKADDPRGFAAAVAASFGGIVTGQGDVIRISAK